MQALDIAKRILGGWGDGNYPLGLTAKRPMAFSRSTISPPKGKNLIKTLKKGGFLFPPFCPQTGMNYIGERTLAPGSPRRFFLGPIYYPPGKIWVIYFQDFKLGYNSPLKKRARVSLWGGENQRHGYDKNPHPPSTTVTWFEQKKKLKGKNLGG